MKIQNLNDFGKRMTVKEVADFLGVSIATVYKKYADLGGMRVGRKYVFFEQRFIDSLGSKSPDAKPDAPESLSPGALEYQVVERLMKPELMQKALFD